MDPVNMSPLSVMGARGTQPSSPVLVCSSWRAFSAHVFSPVLAFAVHPGPGGPAGCGVSLEEASHGALKVALK